MTNGASASGRAAALDLALPELRCPHCDERFTRDGNAVRCPNRHSFDIARDGHLSLLTGRRDHLADTAAMVVDRALVLSSGVFDGVTAATVGLMSGVPASAPTLMVDLAGGTGHLLAALLTSRPERHGILLELSTPALRAAARAHSRIAAIGTDLSNRLPIADATAGLVVSSFGPRPADEIARVLHPDGRLLVVTPGPDHLRELRGVGDVTIDPSKASRLDERLAAFPLDEVVAVRETREVERAVQLALIGMGPSAFHSTPEQRAERAAVLPDPLEVTIDVRVARYRAPRESVAGGPEAEPT